MGTAKSTGCSCTPPPDSLKKTAPQQLQALMETAMI